MELRGSAEKESCNRPLFDSVVDRLKELIKYKGFQGAVCSLLSLCRATPLKPFQPVVPPADLEALLLTHPKVADAGVCGIHDEEQATELPRAYVVPVGGLETLKTDEEKTQFGNEVMKWVEGKVANHKRLRGGVVLVAAIPKR